MSGLAEQLRPEDVPVVLGSPGGPLLLVATGIVMTVSPERATDAVLAGCSAALASLRPRHRQAALDAVAAGRLTPSDAMANVDAVRLLDRQAHHAWLGVAYLPGVAG